MIALIKNSLCISVLFLLPAIVIEGFCILLECLSLFSIYVGAGIDLVWCLTLTIKARQKGVVL